MKNCFTNIEYRIEKYNGLSIIIGNDIDVYTK